MVERGGKARGTDAHGFSLRVRQSPMLGLTAASQRHHDTREKGTNPENKNKSQTKIRGSIIQRERGGQM